MYTWHWRFCYWFSFYRLFSIFFREPHSWMPIDRSIIDWNVIDFWTVCCCQRAFDTPMNQWTCVQLRAEPFFFSTWNWNRLCCSLFVGLHSILFHLPVIQWSLSHGITIATIQCICAISFPCMHLHGCSKWQVNKTTGFSYHCRGYARQTIGVGHVCICVWIVRKINSAHTFKTRRRYKWFLHRWNHCHSSSAFRWERSSNEENHFLFTTLGIFRQLNKPRVSSRKNWMNSAKQKNSFVYTNNITSGKLQWIKSKIWSN